MMPKVSHTEAAASHDKGDHEAAHKASTEAHGHSVKAHETPARAHARSSDKTAKA